MEPYFIWNDTDSRQMGVWVLQYPTITKPPQRYEQVTIPGRPGALTLLEGDDVYDSYIREMQIMPKPNVSLTSVLSWLTGKGTVIFGNQPDRRQNAMVMDAIDFRREFADQYSATVRFVCEPFKQDVFRDTFHTVDLTQEQPFVLTGHGDVVARPLIDVTATGTVTLTINGVSLAVNDLSGETAHIDCSAMTTYRVEETDGVRSNVPVTTHGDYFLLKPHGDNSITWTEGVTALVIHPEWRWL